MSINPFWTPDQYSMYMPQYLHMMKEAAAHIAFTVPIVGMLCGATISGVVIAINYVLKEVQLSI